MIVTLALAAALPPLQAPWNQWHYERRIDTPAKTQTVSFVVPPSLYVRAQSDLSDIRIISENEQTPFAIITPSPAPDVRWREARIEDTGVVRGRYSQAVADLGRENAPYETLEIETPERSFATLATIEASDDRAVWRVVKTRAPLYDYSQDGLDTNLRVCIAPTTARFIRIRVKSTGAFTISGLRAAQSATPPLPLMRYPVEINRVTSTDAKTSVYMLEGMNRVPFQRVEVYAETPRYARNARLEFDDGNGWQPFAASRLVRTPEHDERSFTFDEVQLHRWRLVVENGNDLPLQGIAVYAFGAARRVVFDAKAGRSYRLIYGNPSAERASYDYADTHARTLYRASNVALEAPLRFNLSAISTVQMPWSEQHRWILWGALALAACGVGALALRALSENDST